MKVVKRTIVNSQIFDKAENLSPLGVRFLLLHDNAEKEKSENALFSEYVTKQQLESKSQFF